MVFIRFFVLSTALFEEVTIQARDRKRHGARGRRAENVQASSKLPRSDGGCQPVWRGRASLIHPFLAGRSGRRPAVFRERRWRMVHKKNHYAFTKRRFILRAICGRVFYRLLTTDYSSRFGPMDRCAYE